SGLTSGGLFTQCKLRLSQKPFRLSRGSGNPELFVTLIGVRKRLSPSAMKKETLKKPGKSSAPCPAQRGALRLCSGRELRSRAVREFEGDLLILVSIFGAVANLDCSRLHSPGTLQPQRLSCLR